MKIIILVAIVTLITCNTPAKIQHGTITGKNIDSSSIFGDTYILNISGYNQLTGEFDGVANVNVSGETYYSKKIGDTYDCSNEDIQY